MADVELDVVGQWSWGSLQECGQTFVANFHEENGKFGVGVVIGSRYWGA